MKFLALVLIFSLLLVVSQSFAQSGNNDLTGKDFGANGDGEK
jgi:hypothetical protein